MSILQASELAKFLTKSLMEEKENDNKRTPGTRGVDIRAIPGSGPSKELPPTLECWAAFVCVWNGRKWQRLYDLCDPCDLSKALSIATNHANKHNLTKVNI